MDRKYSESVNEQQEDNEIFMSYEKVDNLSIHLRDVFGLFYKYTFKAF